MRFAASQTMLPISKVGSMPHNIQAITSFVRIERFIVFAPWEISGTSGGL